MKLESEKGRNLLKLLESRGRSFGDAGAAAAGPVDNHDDWYLGVGGFDEDGSDEGAAGEAAGVDDGRMGFFEELGQGEGLGDERDAVRRLSAQYGQPYCDLVKARPELPWGDPSQRVVYVGSSFRRV